MIYNTTTRIAEAALRLRASMGGPATLRERLVSGTAPAPATIWVHGASVGELTSARQVIHALSLKNPVHITANSETGRNLATSWGLPATLAPLDLPGALDRFLAACQPRLLISIEAEFWPLRSRFLAERGVAQALIGARLSERSARTWGRFPRIIRPILSRIDALSAQDQASEARLLGLGLPASSLLPRLDLKLLDPASVTPPADDTDRDRTILAASTHEGEDAIILDAFLIARSQRPELRLILAPRHPDRGDDIAALIAARGLAVIRRSAGGALPEAGGVLLADTLGEMPKWYALAGTCVIGGSLQDHGGHTPWEPAAYCCALLHGPHTGNFVETFDALHAGDAALQVSTATLADHMALTAAKARQLGHAARDLLTARAGDPAPLIDRLAELAQRND
ncbi:3-deoxy-D-manno-octulosonic acid transferase [Paracoccus sp. JM45]|uniref:3-deoxy-D-manno-octulosonic acid transferase n=1 Tax=Paracoccus sp. JM45 TaxID=2283626 RepID=UPI000E6D5559|nr:glycosyltransferase N-terminal domain-containing protein [Paracoccus sp. JM45]RJE81715.1 3-deoxy-D-manno-octulosonic acid transferase [Paracoccus sp. JM45]